MSDPHRKSALDNWLGIGRVLVGSLTDGLMGLGRRSAVLGGFIASGARLALGTFVRRSRLGPRPEGKLVLYEFEGCPFCRKVREAVSMLDLTVEFRPCPKGGERFRVELVERGGKAQFPYLVDKAAGVEMYESGDIIAHLWERYGQGSPPLVLRSNALASLGSLAFAFSGQWGGTRARPSRAPEQPLELWGFEASPFTRFVRQTLCELELPYVLHPVAKNAPTRAAFFERSGKMQVPYLFDANTGAEMFESAAIQAYLEEFYGS